MTREEEIVQASENYYNEVKYLSDLSAFPIAAFKAGADWADNHPNLTWEDIRKICLIAKNVHKYYGFWSQNVYEEIFSRFYKPEIWT